MKDIDVKKLLSVNSPVPVAHVAQLANIPITAEEEKTLEKAFDETLDVIADLNTVDVSGVKPTFQVTGLENVWRDDVVNTERMFSQEQALANVPAARRHDGYIVVPQVIDQE